MACEFTFSLPYRLMITFTLLSPQLGCKPYLIVKVNCWVNQGTTEQLIA